MCELHKTGVFKLIYILNHELTEYVTVAKFFLSCHPIRNFVSFTANAVILTLLSIFLFKILCCHCWKTAAVHQRMIMLELVVGRENSTTTSFTYNTFSSHLGGVASGMLHRKKYKGASCSEAMS